ncbi:hypothetical protein G6F37_007554 [Rhizopus arrhizus]|nr:hypothetical protein G6F38_007753 [Rhizopus arrhizus]KAG1156494.1 hypothetical protein G6F37_007554 [Rhizopus arrhizus]
MSYYTNGFMISRIGRPKEPEETSAKIGEALRYYVDNYWPSIKDWNDAKDARNKFTQSICMELWNQTGPQFVAGYIVTDDDYSTSEEVESWKMEYYGEFRIAQWTYTVLAFPNDRETSFTLHGDGGFLNWCVIGNFTSADDNSHVYFHETEYSKQMKGEDDEERFEKHLEEEEKNKRRHGGNVGPI